MALHIKDIPPEAFVDGHKHHRGIIVPVTIGHLAVSFPIEGGEEIGRCAVCEKGTVIRFGSHQACDKCGSPIAHHPDPEGLLREKNLKEYIQE